jgi:hypothetical protein
MANATRLAGQLLSAIGQGRGAQIAHEILEIDASLLLLLIARASMPLSNRAVQNSKSP